jgi:NADH-quinone oxidoreductase subunit L
VFLGEPRSQSAEHAHETKPVMTVPLVVLAFFAVTAGWVGIPQAFPGLGQISPAWFQHFLGSMVSFEEVEGHSLVPLLTSLVVSLGGLTLGWLVYRRVQRSESVDPMQSALGPVFKLLQRKYYFDEIYQFLFVRPSNWIAETLVYRVVDQTLIDGILHGIAKIGVWVGKGLRFGFDLPV